MIPVSCYYNTDPFNTAFVVTLLVSCSGRGLVQGTLGMADAYGNTTAIDDPPPVCQNRVKPNTATLNGHDYDITDENRNEIIPVVVNLTPTDFTISGG